MMRGVISMFSSNVSFSDEVANYLVLTVREMLNAKVDQQTFGSSTAAGSLQNKGWQRLGNISGYLFEGAIDCDQGRGKFAFILDPKDIPLVLERPGHWGEWTAPPIGVDLSLVELLREVLNRIKAAPNC